jgi:amino acid transporter
MLQVILALIPLSILVFWAWMFADMMKNDNLPSCFVTFTGGRDPKFDWMVVFFLLSFFAAVFYYSNVYRRY